MTVLNRRFLSGIFKVSVLTCSFFLAPAMGTVSANQHDVVPADKQQMLSQLENLHQQDKPVVVHIYFATDSAVISRPYIDTLKQMSDIITSQLNSQVEIAIVGHTDDRASDEYNLNLGQKRADAIREFFTSNGLNDRFIVTNITSEGEKNPLADNSTNEGKAINRRVEIVISLPEKHDWTESPIELSNQGNALLIGSVDKLVLWNSGEQCPQNILPIADEKIYASALSPNGRIALSGGSSRALTLWDVATASPLFQLTGHSDAVSALDFAENNQFAISGSLDRNVKIWDLKNRKELANLAAHKSAVTAVALSNDGKVAASADMSGYITLWDLNKYDKISYTRVHTGQVSEIAFTTDSQTLVSIAKDNQVHRWQIKSDQRDFLRPEQEAEVAGFDISSDDQKILVAYKNGQIVQWDLKNRKPLLEIQKDELTLIATSYLDGDATIAASDSNHQIHYWNASSGAYLSHFASGDWPADDKAITAKSSAQETWTSEDGTKFSWVAPGCYDMGCGPWNKQCSASEEPVHQACHDGFWIAQNEVSQKQWTDLMGYNPSKGSEEGCSDLFGNKKDCPTASVNQVSWLDAQLYICKLNKQTGQVFRLPTEAQWEYACRNGGQPVKYSTSPDPDGENADANKYQLHNMSDSLWEWNLDVYDKKSYLHHQRELPLFTGHDGYHFQNDPVTRGQRGGAWDKGSERSQCSRRHYDEPQSRTFFTGFRLLMEPQG